jgi:hypothetical protein
VFSLQTTHSHSQSQSRTHETELTK